LPGSRPAPLGYLGKNRSRERTRGELCAGTLRAYAAALGDRIDLTISVRLRSADRSR